jgi:hypothetical protein
MPPERVQGISVVVAAVAAGSTTGVGRWRTWGGVGGKGGGGRGGGVIPLLPSVVVNRSAAVSLAGEVTPRSGDGVGRHGGVGVDVDGDRGGLTSSGNKQKSRSPIDAIDDDDDNDDWGRVANSTSVAAVARDEDPVRRRIATSLLNREGRKTAGSRRYRTSLHRGGGIIDGDGGGSLLPSAAALSPRGFVRDASTEEGTTIARMDRDVETVARSYVTSILCQMAEEISD